MESPAPKRRWLRWSLLTMFVVVIVVACWLFTNISRVQEREHLREAVLEKGCGSLGANLGIQPVAGPIPVVWRLLGAKPMPITCTLLPASQFSESEIERIRYLFPDVRVAVSKFGSPKGETRR